MTATETAAPPRRWDPVVKLTHWTIVAAILANALITEEGSDAHVWVGYAVAATLILRLIWGVIGPAEARFSAFPPSPGRALAHIREIATGKRSEHASHNPLGALVVYAIWSTLAVIIVTGVLMVSARPSPKASSARLRSRRPRSAWSVRRTRARRPARAAANARRGRWPRSTRPPSTCSTS